MRTPVLHYSSTTSPNNLADRYIPFQSGAFSATSGSTDVNKGVAIAAVAGTITIIKIDLLSAPGSGASWTYTLNVNGVDTAMSGAISDFAKSVDIVGNESIAIDDLVSIHVSPSGTPVMDDTSITGDFIPDNEGESMICGTYIGSSFPNYIAFQGQYQSGILARAESVAPMDMTLDNLTVDVYPALGSTTFYPVDVMVNGTPSGTLTVTVNNGRTANTRGSGISLSVNKGDLVCFTLGSITGSGGTHSIKVSVRMTPSTAGEYPLMMGNSATLSSTSLRYLPFSGRGASITNDGNNMLAITRMPFDTTIKKMYGLLSSAPGTGTAFNVFTRHNRVAEGPQIQIAGTNVSAEDSVNTVDVSEDDQLNYLQSPVAGPTLPTYYYYSLVAYTPGAAPSTNNGDFFF